jgi:hypothetical protein
MWIVARDDLRSNNRWRNVMTDRKVFADSPSTMALERETAWAAELTPNMVVLGDPLPGRSALDAKHRTSPH